VSEDPTTSDPLSPPSLPSPNREDEPSITGVHGTIARFEMAYSPPSGDGPVTYGPPAKQRWPSLIYFAFTVVVVAVVLFGYFSGSNSRLHVWVLEGDRGRPMPSWFLAGFIFASGVATVLRARMRGVIVSGEGIEARYLMALGVPRVQKWSWAQVDRFIVDAQRGGRIGIELWNGSHELLPDVAETGKLAAHLQSIAEARKKEFTILGELPKRSE
jgi:hypothetical protein